MIYRNKNTVATDLKRTFCHYFNNKTKKFRQHHTNIVQYKTIVEESKLYELTLLLERTSERSSEMSFSFVV